MVGLFNTRPSDVLVVDDNPFRARLRTSHLASSLRRLPGQINAFVMYYELRKYPYSGKYVLILGV